MLEDKKKLEKRGCHMERMKQRSTSTDCIVTTSK